MRVTATRWIRRSFQLLALPASVVLSSMVLGSDGSQTVSETDSVPIANVALPLVSSFPLQKASSGAFSATEIHPVQWDLPSAASRTGNHKSAFRAEIAGCVPSHAVVVPAASVAEVAALQPTPIPLPTCEEFDVAVANTAVASILPAPDHGFRKSGAQLPPQLGEIAMVKWEASNQCSVGGGKVPMRQAFAASDCPTIAWDNSPADDFLPEPASAYPVGSSSELAYADSAESVSGKAFLTSISRQTVPAVPADVMKELTALTPAPAPVSVRDSYIAELNQLLEGQSNWVFGNEKVVDLAPGEPEVAGSSYLDELNALASRSNASTGYHNTAFTLQDSAVKKSDEKPTGAPTHKPNFPIENAYQEIGSKDPNDPKFGCKEGVCGQKSLYDYFQPLTSVYVTGMSSQPPSRAKATDNAKLTLPDDSACLYMDNASPIAYHVPPRFGGSRPSRNTLKLCHNPLYYEDPNLERCGQSYGCLSTAASVVHFSSAIAMTPFKMSQNCPRDCVQALPDCPTCHKFGKDAYCSGR